jgi:hypothetical protein
MDNRQRRSACFHGSNFAMNRDDEIVVFLRSPRYSSKRSLFFHKRFIWFRAAHSKPTEGDNVFSAKCQCCPEAVTSWTLWERLAADADIPQRAQRPALFQETLRVCREDYHASVQILPQGFECVACCATEDLKKRNENSCFFFPGVWHRGAQPVSSTYF